MADYSKIISEQMKKLAQEEIIFDCPFENQQLAPKFLGFFLCKNICSTTSNISPYYFNIECKLYDSCPCLVYGSAFGKERALNYSLYPPVQLGD